ncbi:hypothetical protein RJ639_001547 [Escallonia herrerae]|uniref:Uncharacterized protein n=1 Tax=Escallonia herrerae TaxID=1293975 RepID=A0AA89BIP6_9ASTE|nr:hypothetical protein RJ639_001547 [Escallonia herrerae]
MAKAVISSHTPALYSLAVIQFNGSDGSKNDKDLRASVALCARATFLGHIDALQELGHCLQDGYGIHQYRPKNSHPNTVTNTVQTPVDPNLIPATRFRHNHRLLDAPGNIHSIYFSFKSHMDTYFDVFGTLPLILPPRPFDIGAVPSTGGPRLGAGRDIGSQKVIWPFKA